MSRGISFKRKSGNTTAGGGCLILFGLIFGGMGLLFVILLGTQLAAEAETYSWTETPCEVLQSEIEVVPNKSDNPFRLKVRYSYRFEGSRYESEQYALQDKESDEYEDLALRLREIFEKPEAVCWVNPDSPSEAVMKREALFTGLFMLFPMIFVVIGGGIVWGGVISLRKERKEKKEGRKTAISEAGSASKASGRAVGIWVGALFAVIGLGIFIGMANGPLKRMVISRYWAETPCKVIWSQVRSHDSDDGTTYSVDIFYEYEFAGQTHRSNRYQSMSGSSSGHSGKAAIVRKYPAGSQQVCYVNPDVPEQAVLVPGFTAWALFGLFPLVFFGVGAVVLWASWKTKKPAAAVPSDSISSLRDFKTSSELHEETGESGGALVLNVGGSRLAKVGCMLFCTLFWNGIVSVFVVDVVKGWQTGNGSIFQTLFMIPFVLVGIGFLVAFFYQAMATLNPRPRLVLPGGKPRLGETIEIQWTLAGRVSRMVDLQISLWGIEAATYRRGTNTVTSQEVFLNLPVAELTTESEMRSGSATVAIPEDLMYSIKLSNNEIKYEIRVTGDVPLWPDLSDTFELTLLPPQLNSD